MPEVAPEVDPSRQGRAAVENAEDGTEMRQDHRQPREGSSEGGVVVAAPQAVPYLDPEPDAGDGAVHHEGQEVARHGIREVEDDQREAIKGGVRPTYATKPLKRDDRAAEEDDVDQRDDASEVILVPIEASPRPVGPAGQTLPNVR